MERSTVRVVLLDDEPFILKMHAHMLKELGFSSIRAFESGFLALDEIKGGSKPDLILLDLSMPGMDGIEFIRGLVGLGYAGRVILVSGEDERLLQTAKRIVAAHGIDILGHIEKPVRPNALRSILEEWEARTAAIPRPLEKVYDAHDLRKALSHGEIVNHYQPKISLNDGTLVGVESLARWMHPQDGLVAPMRFIGIAEQHGMIDELTRVTFTSALTETVELDRAGLNLQVAVNLAASTLGSLEFADFAATEAARASISPTRVVIEVTESQLVSDTKVSLDVLTRLRLRRFQLSIDDFGTGYSSLSQLRDIPFDELKIDQSFVHNSTTDATARAMYDASCAIARQLNMKTVAEGVENRNDWKLVTSTGCNTAQGYLIAKAMPAQALVAWAAEWRERAKGLTFA